MVCQRYSVILLGFQFIFIQIQPINRRPAPPGPQFLRPQKFFRPWARQTYMSRISSFVSNDPFVGELMMHEGLSKP